MSSTRLPDDIRKDQSSRWRGGEVVLVERYLDEFPALHADPEAVLDLIYSEIVLREEAGQAPHLAEYVARFGRFEEQLRLLFEVHRTLEQGSLADSLSQSHTPLPGPRAARDVRGRPTLPGYTILEEVGRGGMGVVYRARQERPDRVVALKMLLTGSHAGEAERARFQAEAEAVARLQHANIVQVFEVGEHAGQPYFSMEYVDGVELSDLAAGTPQTAAASARTVATLARAIHFAHQRGVLHRDLKPANVLLVPLTAGADGGGTPPPAAWGTPKITDFGLAKRLDDPAGQTRSGDILGTPSYMAPEQAAGDTCRIGPATDTYALGVVLYELLIGRPPFKGDSALDTLSQVVHEDPVPPSRLRPRLPRDLETICLKCLEKEPANRYASAAALADDLDRFLDGRPIRARPAGWIVRTAKWVRRRPAAALLYAIAGLAAVAVPTGFVAYRGYEQQRTATIRNAVGQSLQEAAESLRRGDYGGARSGAAAVVERLRAESGIADLHDEARGLAAEAEALAEFTRYRDAAFFARLESLGRGAEGGGQSSLQDAAAKNAERALQAVGLAPAGDDRWSPDGRFRDAGRRAAVTEGCSLLLLTLADAVAERPAAAKDRDAPLREALRLVDQAGIVSPPTRVHHLRRARYLRGLGDAAGGKEEERLAAGSEPRSAHEFFLIGDERYKRGDGAAAIAAFRDATALDPGHFWGQFGLARCFLDVREWDKAGACLTVCLVLRPDDVYARVMRGYAYREQGAFRAAEQDFEQAQAAVERRPDDEGRFALLINRGLLRFRQDRLDPAAGDFREAAALRPERFEPHLNLVRVFQRQKKAEEAAAAFQRTLALRPPAIVLADYHAERGRDLFYDARDYAAAVGECQAALRCKDDYVLAWGVLGQSFVQLKRFAEAAAAFDRYLRCGGPPVADVFRGRGHARMKLGDFLGARDDFARVVDRQPDAEAFSYRGWAYFFADAWRPARQDFDRALQLDAGRVDAYTGRALARVMLGNYREAIEDADEAWRRKPDTPEMVHNLACVFAQAAVRAGADAPPDRTTLAASYRERAVQTVRHALALLPAGERRGFLRENVLTDHALDPIRATAGYRQLLREYDLPAENP